MRINVLVLAVLLAASAGPASAQTAPAQTPQSLEQLLRALLGSSGAGSLPSTPDGGLEGLLGTKTKEGDAGDKRIPSTGPLVDGPFSRSGAQSGTQSFRRDDYLSGVPLSPVVTGPRSLVEAARAAARQRCTKEPDEKKRAACLVEAGQK